MNPETTPTTITSPDGHVWIRDVDHTNGPRSPFMVDLFESGFRDGFADAFARLGAPLAGAEIIHPEGWTYTRMVPAGAPDKPGAGTPPRLVLKLLTRLHPELRARERQARRALEEELWLNDADAWAAERDDWARRLRARVDTDLSTLDDEAVAAELDHATSDAGEMTRRHFELVTLGVGVGLVLVDRGPDVLHELRDPNGAAEGPAHLLRELAAELADRGATSVRDLDDIRAASRRAAILLDELIRVYGWRIMADDIAAATLAERPQALMAAIGSAGRTPAHASSTATSDAALAAASRCLAALDDNSATVAWAFGALRRVALEAGRRLHSRGQIGDPDHVFAMVPDEVSAALRGAAEPSAEEIEARYRRWREAFSLDAPVVIGGAPAPPPDAEVFPPAMARITEAVAAYIGLKITSPTPEGTADTAATEQASGRVEAADAVVARGLGIGTAVVEGRAVVVSSPDEALDRIQPGDILVCDFTSPAYNAVFGLLGAVVCATGGELSHAAVTAREIGIPAVVNVGDLGGIPDGEVVRVVAGEGDTPR